jgi:hypothetical protein
MSQNESSKKADTDEGGKVKPPLDKIIIDTQPPRSGTCVFQTPFYALGMC